MDYCFPFSCFSFMVSAFVLARRKLLFSLAISFHCLPAIVSCLINVLYVVVLCVWAYSSDVKPFSNICCPRLSLRRIFRLSPQQLTTFL